MKSTGKISLTERQTEFSQNKGAWPTNTPNKHQRLLKHQHEGSVFAAEFLGRSVLTCQHNSKETLTLFDKERNHNTIHSFI